MYRWSKARSVKSDFRIRISQWRHIPGLALAALLVHSISSLLSAQESPPTPPPVVLSEEALKIHREALLIDGHNDLPWELRTRADSGFEKFDIARPQPKLHTDIERFRKGGVGGQFWSAYVPADTIATGDSLQQTLEQIDLIHRMLRRYPDVFELALTADDVERIHRSGKIASLIGIEGGHSIQNSLGVLRQLYSMGARYMTLTHSETLGWADSATDTPRHGGLAPFGEDVVREMNRLGMLVDISHVSAETMHDALDISKAPIIASHSSTYAIAQHPRNVPDDVLRRLRDNGGVVMINFFSGFVVPESAKTMSRMFEVRRELKAKYPDEKEYERQYSLWRRANPFAPGTVHTVVDHIDHVVKVAGVDHVGLGSDYDGITTTPKQLEDVSCYPYITQELLNRGYTAEQIKKILGLNVLRALRGAEQTAKELAGRK
jgi:membrane dipeptidase